MAQLIPRLCFSRLSLLGFSRTPFSHSFPLSFLTVSSLFLLLALLLSTNSGLAAHCLKANAREISVGGKGKVALFRRPATWGEGGLMSQRTNSQLPLTGQEPIKGSFKDV